MFEPGSVTLRSSGTPTGLTTVTFSSSLSCGTAYTVALTLTSDSNLSGSSGWGYIAGQSKVSGGFSVLLNSSGGTAFNAPAGTTVDWIATCNQ